VYHQFIAYPNAYRECEQALRHSRYFNMGQIIYYEDIEEKEHKHAVIDESELSSFETALKFGNKKEINDAICHILYHLQKQDDQVIIDPQFVIIKLVNSLLNFASSINVNINQVMNGNIMEEMLSFTEIDDLREYVYNITLKLRENNVKTQVNKTEQIIEEVYQYIENNYSNPAISLETITFELGISVSYLSMLLKKMKGVTFNKELIRYRMEKAKELLKYSNEKIVNIAKMVGYNEVYYFSHSFKKFTTMSPKEFRESV
jgi:two-component system response regulator YesN